MTVTYMEDYRAKKKDEPLFYETIKSQKFTPIETRRPRWTMKQAEAERALRTKLMEGERDGKQR